MGLRVWFLGLALLLASCGGGGGSTTTLRCGTTNCQTLNPAVSTPFVQGVNNLRVTVDDQGPHGFSSSISTNVLFATVTVCALGGTPGNNTQCATIDHVLVDTGSVGLRVLASKVQGLGLLPIQPTTGQNAWECFPFVIGGLWGANVAADVWLGQQRGATVPVQLIDDRSAMNPTADCISVTDNSLLTSAASLGANGILGIGSTLLDCGADCVSGTYHVNSSSPPGSSVLYYACPTGATNSSACSLTPMPANMQMFNPVAALPMPYNNGVVLKMPAIPTNQTGAATAAGELILGVDPSALPSGAIQVMLGTNPATDSYLSVNTQFNGHTYPSSYLDTGTNGMFFYDASITRCASSSASSFWYCPSSTLANLQAVLSDGDNITQNQVPVTFQIANFNVLSNTSNTAFADAAGAVGTTNSSGVAVPDTKTFAWGMPFFYGRQVYLSIWQQSGSLNGPWYAWAPL